MLDSMAKTGLEYGIKFAKGGQIGSTFNCHRLMELALDNDMQDVVIEEIFHLYFELTATIACNEVLAIAAHKTGLFNSKEEARAWLETDELAARTRRRISLAGKMKVAAVPYFVIDNTYALSGAQPAEVFEQVFAKLGLLPPS
mmetsp:Transcript_13776/g.15433  ORF Transcript_13776/g.15433 Transcript_13776/m.15433 type:complete len:143 (+) Transcript_13776:231-659(+)